jgi:flagellar protein FlaJ
MPFVTLHMSAIAGSGIIPIDMFKIIAESKDYPKTIKEIIRLINQINVYGYDLLSGLRNSAKISPSKKLSELFSGMATTLGSGGNLTNYLKDRAERFLFDYTLLRQRYNKLNETFMNIYISVVIAAPMILMLMLIMIGMTGFASGWGVETMSIIVILIVIIINFLFMAFLQIKQGRLS